MLHLSRAKRLDKNCRAHQEGNAQFDGVIPAKIVSTLKWQQVGRSLETGPFMRLQKQISATGKITDECGLLQHNLGCKKKPMFRSCACYVLVVCKRAARFEILF